MPYPADDEVKEMTIVGIFSKNDAIEHLERKFDLNKYTFHAYLSVQDDTVSVRNLLDMVWHVDLKDEGELVLIADGKLVPAVLKAVIDLLVKPRSIILVDPVFDSSLKPELHNIGCPVLIISGIPRGKNYVFDHINYRDLIPGSSIKYVRDINKSSLENPAKVYNYITDFISNE